MQSTHRSNNLRSLLYIMLMCFCLPMVTGCSSSKTIVNSLDEKEANEIIVYLSTKNIDVIKVPAKASEGGGGGGVKIQLWDISVPDTQALEAMSYLNQVGLPRRRSQNLLGIFTGTGLVPSEMEQQIRYQAGLAEQIASIIRKIDGILDAEVQISFPKEDPLNPSGEKKQKITASVYVKHNGVLDDPNSHLVTKIKRLVAASIAGLDYDNVTVIGERARFSEYQPLTNAGAAGEEEKQYVTVWSIILAKESLSRFRLIFFSFTILILVLAVILSWILWKIHPVLKAQGGFRELFHLKPIDAEPSETSPKEQNKEEPKKENAPENETPASTADKDIDQT
jgi:type III secretion protein J